MSRYPDTEKENISLKVDVDMRTSVFGISVKYFLRLSTRCVDNSRTACLGRIRVI